MQIQLYGASLTVTGSKTLVITQDQKLLVDCGLFQGTKNLRLRNWDRPPVNPKQLDAIILTHAHLDHSGYLPVLTKHGLRAPIYCTYGSAELLRILLMDSAKLQEEDAAYANKKGFSKHHPALPLYTTDDVEETLKLVRPIEFNKVTKLSESTQITFYPAGHIIGSSFVLIADQNKSVVFSGDIGRFADEVMNSPHPLPVCDALVLESTYGDREHNLENPEVEMARFILEVFQKGGEVIIPAFAVGRTQKVIYHLQELIKHQVIPRVPIYMDSPMGINASEIFCKYHREHKLSPQSCHLIFDKTILARTQQDSFNIAVTPGPKIVISSSGMATGGRVLHHLARALPHPHSGILFSGYQARGTRGARILAGEPSIKIHGQEVPIRAKIANIESMSAHADSLELIQWIKDQKQRPKKIFLNHGEEHALHSFAHKLQAEFSQDDQTQVMIAQEFETYSL